MKLNETGENVSKAFGDTGNEFYGLLGTGVFLIMLVFNFLVMLLLHRLDHLTEFSS